MLTVKIAAAKIHDVASSSCLCPAYLWPYNSNKSKIHPDLHHAQCYPDQKSCVQVASPPHLLQLQARAARLPVAALPAVNHEQRLGQPHQRAADVAVPRWCARGRAQPRHRQASRQRPVLVSAQLVLDEAALLLLLLGWLLLLLWRRLGAVLLLLPARMWPLLLAVRALPVLLLAWVLLLLLLLAGWPLLLVSLLLLLLVAILLILLCLSLLLLILLRILLCLSLLVAVRAAAAAICPSAKVPTGLPHYSFSTARLWLCIPAPGLCLLLPHTRSCSSPQQRITRGCWRRCDVCSSCMGCRAAAAVLIDMWLCKGHCMRPKACSSCSGSGRWMVSA